MVKARGVLVAMLSLCQLRKETKIMEKKRAPGNTAQQAKDDPMGVLAKAFVMGTDASIRDQEADGQRSLVASDTLPTDIGRHSDHDEKAILEAAGVKFLGGVDGDELFQYVELPAGWKKVGTDHSMWSKLVDDKGRERASIFYKAAFYDREEKEGVAVAHVMDCGQVVFTTEPIQLPEDRSKRREIAESVSKTATKWLDEQHPDWRDPGAYWD